MPALLTGALLCAPWSSLAADRGSPGAKEGAASRRAIQAVSLPVPAGVAGQVRLVIHASAARVAALAGDPAVFRELFPAEEVRVVGQRDQALLVSVRKREAWPVGELRWVESLSRGHSGDAWSVTREVVESTFFRRMRAVMQVTPLPPDAAGERSTVEYRVDVELLRWAPAFAMRRSHLNAVVATMERLRSMSER